MIYVNKNAKNPLAVVFAHELTHSLEGTDAYDTLSGMVFRNLRAQGADIGALRDNRLALDAKFGVESDLDSVDFEIVADYVSENFMGDEAKIRSIVSEDRSLAVKIREFFDRVLAKFGNEGAKARVEEYNQIKEVRDLYKKALGETVESGDRKNSFAGGKYNTLLSYSKNKIDKITKKQYNDYGWIRANDVLTSDEYKDFTSKISDTSNLKKAVRSKDGEYIIPVGGINDDYGFGVDNILVYTNGNMSSPKINKIIKINLENETEIEQVRKEIYEIERKKVSPESIEIIESYFKNGLVQRIYRSDVYSYEEFKRSGKDGGGYIQSGERLFDGRRSDSGSKGEIQPVKEWTFASSPNDKKFSLSAPIEYNETLLAVHNKDWEYIRDAVLDWGGIPAPSIAIVEAQQGHTQYGDTSIVFPRATIDPQTDSRNKVYGSDAWTPTRKDAQVEHEVNYEAKRTFEDMIEYLSGQFADGAFRNGSVIGSLGVVGETDMTLDEIARKLSRNPAVQAAYLQNMGETLEPVYREKSFDSLGNEVLRAFAYRVGYQELARLNVDIALGNAVDTETLEAARDIIIEKWADQNEWRLRGKPEIREKRIENQRNKLTDWRVEDFIRHAWEYYEKHGVTSGVIDTAATRAEMMEMILPGGSLDEVEQVVQEWVRPQLEGILGKQGIFNGKDRVTDEGRLEFWETHYPFNAENIVRAMYEQGEERGRGLWNISSAGLLATATPEYGSVGDIHADENRLKVIDQSEYRQLMHDIDTELERVTDDIMSTSQRHYDSDYEEGQNIGEVVLRVARGEHTIPAVKKAFRKEGYAVTNEQARDVLNLIDRVSSVPTGYFEAKPQRVVGFDEAIAVIAPDNVPQSEIEAVRNAGVEVIQY